MRHHELMENRLAGPFPNRHSRYRGLDRLDCRAGSFRASPVVMAVFPTGRRCFFYLCIASARWLISSSERSSLWVERNHMCP